MTQTNEELQRRIKKLEKQNEQLKETIRNQDKLIEQLETELTEILTETNDIISTINETNETTINQLNKFSSDIITSTMNYPEISEEVSTIQKSISMMTKYLSQHENELEKKEEKQKELEIQKNKFENEINEIQIQLNQKDCEMKQLKKTIAQQGQFICNLEDELVEVLNETNAIIQTVNENNEISMKSIDEISEQMKKEINENDISDELKSLKESIDLLNNEIQNETETQNQNEIKEEKEDEMKNKIIKEDEQTQKIIFNCICLSIKFMLGKHKNINSTDLFEQMKNDQIPMKQWPLWIEEQYKQLDDN